MWGRTRRLHLTRSTPQSFQSTPPCGGERGLGDQGKRRKAVSIHAPVWGRTAARPTHHRRCVQSFNPRPRVGANLEQLGRKGPVLIVSIHAPVWGRTGQIATAQRAVGVSIHAPVWGRTLDQEHPSPPALDVSIHAPVWGRTCLALIVTRGTSKFQSTPPCGGEPDRGLAAGLARDVSIHAPVWGRTS